MIRVKNSMLLPFGLGLTSMSTQLIMLREFMVLFNGNEMVIGIVLSNWMLLTGLGAWLGRFYHRKNPDLAGIPEGLFLLAMLAPLTLFPVFVTFFILKIIFLKNSDIRGWCLLFGCPGVKFAPCSFAERITRQARRVSK